MGRGLELQLVGLTGLVFSAFVVVSLSTTGASSGQNLTIGGLTDNLDLPYDALGSDEEEEEDAPEVIFFYGQPYESSATVFALDESGSMESEGRWDLQSREVTRAISALGNDAEFSVVYYGSRVTAFRESPVPATESGKNAANAFVRSRRPNGDTCTGEGVAKALQIVRKSAGKHKAVIVTSDGRPDVCATGNRANAAEIERIIQMTVSANPGLLVKVHTIWVGRSGEMEAIRFMRRLAEAHGGTFRLVTR